jgi:succinate dehydrogenase/fumarate reductase flavoprotein subunit
MLAPKNIVWHETAEVVVIGYGLAGAVAAITAHDSGANVIIMEKQQENAVYSCSSLSGGVFICPTNYEDAVQHMTALSQLYPGVEWTDQDTIKAWANYSVQNRDWLNGIGATIKYFTKGAENPQIPGGDCIEVWQFPGRGLGMMNFMYRTVASRKIKVLYETQADRLYTDTNGEVIGVNVLIGQDANKGKNIRATKAVILCSGGFEHNEEMKLQYLRVYPVHFSGGMANTGDGIKMAQEVGADLWHMNCVSARLVAKFPGFPLSITLDPMIQDPENRYGYIIVDRYGRRFMAENVKMHGAAYELSSFDSHKLEHPKVPSYIVFDQRRMDDGPLAWRESGPAGPVQMYHWSLDNSVELERGWIIKGNSIAELADRIGILPIDLENTVERWNAYCQEGKDVEFGRKSTGLVPLNTKPFYAIKLFPGGPNTQGGPRRNCMAQVINPFGNPIPRLFSAGECGSSYGMLYPAGGGNLAECIAFGRIAGENAVKGISK